MHRRWAAFAAAAVVAVASRVPLTGPAAANHQDETLLVTVAVNASGDDRITVTDDSYDSIDYRVLASEAAVALGQPVGSFRTEEDLTGGGAILDDKLAMPNGRGRLGFAVDTGELQLVAQRRSYAGVAVRVCTPKVAQLVDVLTAPQSLPSSPGSRCRGWYLEVEEAPVRAAFELVPDRQRYPSALTRTAGVAAATFGLVGIGATLLRRRPLKRRSLASWLLAAGSAVGVSLFGWTAVSLALWLSGATADPVLLGGGSGPEQVARALLPGLMFLVPALLPAVVLLTVPPREKAARRPGPPVGPPQVAWWPLAWWPQWAAQNRPPAPEAAGGPSPAPRPPPLAGPPPDVPGGAPGWAAPGSGGG